METPIWSSIVYLNSAAECSGAEGASAGQCRLSATLIMNQTFDPSTRQAVRIPCALPASPLTKPDTHLPQC